ncbi:MAG TPA: ABC transporter substrate-binding protein, partial [Methylomirabilota bacterium]
MNVKYLAACLSVVSLIAGPSSDTAIAQPKEIYIPPLVYRTGPYASSGIPVANGLVDYYTLINTRDGGVNGTKLAWEKCETRYDTKQSVECYERIKAKGAVLVFPLSTGATYQIVPMAPVDKIPVFQIGAG